jgi:hypothetical protein
VSYVEEDGKSKEGEKNERGERPEKSTNQNC